VKFVKMALRAIRRARLKSLVLAKAPSQFLWEGEKAHAVAKQLLGDEYEVEVQGMRLEWSPEAKYVMGLHLGFPMGPIKVTLL